MKPLFLSCLSIFLLTLNAHASEKAFQPLDIAQLEALLSGKTIKGEYRFMRARTKTFHFQEQHLADGTTYYKEGDIKINGVWYTLGKAKICYRYPNIEEMGGTSCFWVYKDDQCFYGYGLSEMTLEGPRSFNDWGARWVVVGSGGSCDTPVS